MSRALFWYRTAGFSFWGLVVLGALKSEPLWHRLLGDQYAVTHQWCGDWGCSAALPKLLAWQIPMSLVTVPAAWLAVRRVRAVQRWSRVLAFTIIAGTLGWIATVTVQSWSIEQVHSASDVGRRVVFAAVAGTSVAIPLLLASIACLCGPPLRTNADRGTVSEITEDVSNIVVPHVDTAT